ncbi:MAG: Sua5/YciO/YrdC/YwlC family protein [Psychrobium sp.]|nr:Sua5/YciO/YrdC/YwlC family protein [Psychrobium sp.]
MAIDLSSALTSLKQGLVIAYPTEAVYGLGCDPMNQHAVQTLLNHKQRPVKKGLILVAGSFDELAPYVDLSNISDVIWQKINATWPGPYTWVLPKSKLCPSWISGEFDSVAVRVSKHQVIAQLSKSYKGAIVSTSANLAGQTPALNALQVFAMFGNSLGDVIDAPLGDANNPSQIFDALTGKQFR